MTIENVTNGNAKTTLIHIFDADGVVIEPWGFATAVEAEYGISLDDTRDFFRGPFRDCLLGAADLIESVEPYLAGWHWPGTARDFVDYWMASDDLPDSRVLSHVRNLRAAGSVCCLASNQERNRAKYIRERMAFEEKFDRLFFSCELGYAKPDKKFFDSIAKTLGVPPSAICFWDDSLKYVDAARRAGWTARQFSGIESFGATT